jgi:hypothetical protein
MWQKCHTSWVFATQEFSELNAGGNPDFAGSAKAGIAAGPG